MNVNEARPRTDQGRFGRQGGHNGRLGYGDRGLINPVVSQSLNRRWEKKPKKQNLWILQRLIRNTLNRLVLACWRKGFASLSKRWMGSRPDQGWNALRVCKPIDHSGRKDPWHWSFSNGKGDSPARSEDHRGKSGVGGLKHTDIRSWKEGDDLLWVLPRPSWRSWGDHPFEDTIAGEVVTNTSKLLGP